MHRFALVVALATLAAPAALAQEAKGDACILTATETLQSPKKGNLFTLRLDCGSEPTAPQQAAVAAVASKSNFADGVQYMLGQGYGLAGASTYTTFTGNAIRTVYTFVKTGAAMAPVEEDDGLRELEDKGEPAEEFPVLEPKPADPATPAPQ